MSWMNTCLKDPQYYSSPPCEQRAKVLVRWAKQRSKHVTITSDWILTKARELDNFCESCRYPLLWKQQGQNRLDPSRLSLASLDRIEPGGPYSATNIQLVCQYCNRARNKSRKRDWDLFCGALWDGDEIPPHVWTHSEKLAFVARVRSKHPAITVEWLMAQLKSGPKCALTGLPLIPSTLDYHPLKPSVDRLDNTQGHHNENCQVVCLAVNLGRGQVLDHLHTMWYAMRKSGALRRTPKLVIPDDLSPSETPPLPPVVEETVVTFEPAPLSKQRLKVRFQHAPK